MSRISASSSTTSIRTMSPSASARSGPTQLAAPHAWCHRAVHIDFTEVQLSFEAHRASSARSRFHFHSPAGPAGLVDDLHTKAFRVPFGVLRDPVTDLGEDSPRAPHTGSDIDESRLLHPRQIGAENTFGLIETPHKQRLSFVSSVLTSLGIQERLVVVQLIERELWLD